MATAAARVPVISGVDENNDENNDKLGRLAAWVASHCPAKQQKAWEGYETFGRKERSPGDCVMVASRDVPKGKKLPIPPECILTEDIVADSPVGKAFVGLDKYTHFALFLMWQKRVPNSHWSAYLDVLPTDISMHPITFLRRPLLDGTKLKAALDAHPALVRALGAQQSKLDGEWERCAQVMRLHRQKKTKAFESLLGAFEGPSTPSMDEFVWANCMVISRAFNMAEPRVMCMLPFVDSMNHSLDAHNVMWRPKLPRGFFVISFHSNVVAGEEILAKYHDAPRQGSVAMDELRRFVMYGFSDLGTFSDVLEAAKE